MTFFKTYFSPRLNELLVIRNHEDYQKLHYENSKVQMPSRSYIRDLEDLEFHHDYVQFEGEDLVLKDPFDFVSTIFYKILEESSENFAYSDYLNQENKRQVLNQAVQEFKLHNPEMYI